MKIESYEEMEVYCAACEFQQAIFQMSKPWPKVENFSLTDQIRRSSRSIGANIAEAWAKRRYPAHFLSKLTDSDGELQETKHWLWTAHQCDYISEPEYMAKRDEAESVGRLLGGTIKNYKSFCL